MTRVMRILGSVALLIALAMPAAAQGVLAPYAVLQFFDNNGDPLNGGFLLTYDAGTTTPRSVYTDAALSVAHTNPVVLDSAGRAAIYLDPTRSYKFTLQNSLSDSVWTRDNIIGAQSGVLTVSAADTRALRVTRAGADAGISVTSSGGSGKTYGLVSDTAGGFTIRDDSDGTPNMQWLGNNITATMTGVFAVTGNQTVSGTLTASSDIIATTAIPRFVLLETDATANNKRWSLSANADDLLLSTVDDAVTGGATVWSVQRTGTVVDSFTLSPTAVINTGRYHSSTLQPGFLVYNSVTDSPVDTGTVDFDAELYDNTASFASDTFTAPVTGIYQLCPTVAFSGGTAGGSSVIFTLVTSNRSYMFHTDDLTSATARTASACVFADMDAADTASVQWANTAADGIAISGSASPYFTFFSGRLVP